MLSRSLGLWIIGYFEKFSHKVQRAFGKDCFWLARACIALYVLGGVSGAAALLAFERLESAVPLAGVNILMMLGVPTYIKDVKEAEDGVWRKPDLANIRKLDADLCLPILFCFLLFFSIAFFLYQITASRIGLFYCLTLSFSYVWIAFMAIFMSCDPLRPSKSTFEKFKDSVTSWLKGFILGGSLQPAPVRLPR